MTVTVEALSKLFQIHISGSKCFQLITKWFRTEIFAKIFTLEIMSNKE